MGKASNKNEPLISVIIPVYKVEQYLDKCIESVVNQTYKNLEIILVDDGSPDTCPQKCDDWKNKDKRIIVIHKENGGLSDARNKGIDISKGKYITFIDSDDYIEEQYIEILFEMIIKNKTKISVADNLIEYVDGNVINNSTYENYLATPFEFFEKMLWGIRDLDNGAWTKMYSKELFDDVRFPVGKNYEDTATIYKIIDKCEKIAINSVPIYHYMKRKDSITQGKFSIKKLELLDATQQMTDYVRNKYNNLSTACDRKMLWAYFSVLSQYAVSNQKDKKIERMLFKYIKENRLSVLKNKNTPKRDKVAILCSLFGFGFYKFSWKCYLRLTKKY